MNSNVPKTYYKNPRNSQPLIYDSPKTSLCHLWHTQNGQTNNQATIHLYIHNLGALYQTPYQWHLYFLTKNALTSVMQQVDSTVPYFIMPFTSQ